jgi:hypothetical protein
MWLGALGQQLWEWLPYIGLLGTRSFATHLAFLQFPVAITHTLGILIGYHLRTDPGTIQFNRSR